MKTYAQKLLHPKWQKKRLEIMRRDDFCCIECGNDEETLNVHHKSYIFGNDIWDYPDSNFQTLCESCHKQITDLKKQIKHYIDNYYCLDSLPHTLNIIEELANRTPNYHLLVKKYVLNKMDADSDRKPTKSKRNG